MSDFDELVEAVNKENDIEDEPLNYRILSPEEREYAWARLMFKSSIISAFKESYDRNSKKEEA